VHDRKKKHYLILRINPSFTTEKKNNVI